ncbi:MAG: hypothetical protein AABX23_03260 [Nanoarchaeota archaeon]
MNSRGFDIAITTIILIVIGVAILIGFVFFIKNGFSFFKSGTEPILKTQSLEATRQACELICRSDNEITFCCESMSLNNEEIYCGDSRLNVNCNFDCSKVVCS